MASITERDGVFRIRVSMRVGGQIRQDSMTWKPDDGMSKYEISRALNKTAMRFEDEFRKSSAPADRNATFEEFSKRWMKEYASANIRAKSYRRYESLLVRINQGIGNIRLSRLKASHIIEFMKNLAEIGIRDDVKCVARTDIRAIIQERDLRVRDITERSGASAPTLYQAINGKCIMMEKAIGIAQALGYEFHEIFAVNEKAKETLSEKSLLHYYSLISVILNTAVYWEVIPANPINQVRTPSVQNKQAKYLDDDEAVKLLQYLEPADSLHRIAIITLLYTGCRRSELLALKWEDIDFKNHWIEITKSLHYLPDRGLYMEATKTEESNRSVKLVPELADALKAWRTEQKRDQLAAGNAWDKNGFVFANEQKQPLRPDCLTFWFSKFVGKHADLPAISIHSLRHTAATLMIMGGAPLRAVSDMLGHAKPTTTFNIYSHAIKKYSDGAADILSNMLKPQMAMATER